MSTIVNLLKEKYLNKIKTTKDLIYKDQIVDPHNINDSYQKLIEDNKALEIDLKYGKQKYYLTLDSLKIVLKLNYFNVFLLNKIGFKPNKIKDFYLSEIHNSLWIEGIKSSKKKIKQFLKEEFHVSKDENFKAKISKNYAEALKLVFNTNTINESLMYSLYNILAKDIDMKENTLDGFPYRQDDVEIGREKIKGIDPNLIKGSVDNMFKFIDHEDSDNNFEFLNSVLLHLNFEHIHPYYDMNGRMGRLLLLWYSNKKKFLPQMLYLSEAINMFKYDLYYPAFKAIREKNFKFDATYFIGSILTSLVANKMVYLVMKEMENTIMHNYKIKFNDLQKSIIMNLLSKDLNVFYEKEELILGVSEINPGQFSKAINQLVELNLISEVVSKPKKYALNPALKIEQKFKKMIDNQASKINKYQ